MTLSAVTPNKRTFAFSTALPKLMPDLAEFCTTEEAAKLLGFSAVSVRNLVYKKKLDSMRFGRSLLIPKKSIREYLEKTQGMNKHDPRRNTK